MISSGAEAADRKQRIRDRYKGVDTSELEVIPAKTVEGLGESTSIRRVAAYVRVYTDNDEQTSSYELQKNYYTDYIKAQPGWEFVGIYDDEGISGTSLEHRKGMQQLIEDCKVGKIDLILTKSIARFARNIVDCLSVIETLKNLDPPVGVKFEADDIYTLDSNGRMILTILASVAEEESHSKSIIMNWSIDRRFSRGLFLTPALLGYDQDEDGSLVVNQDEAQTVKVIYYLYLNGFSFTEIAELLTEYGRKTKLGNTEWNPGTLAGAIANERHCGDVLARKTFTSNFLTHKSKKNNNDRTQYRQRDHHEAIVSREVYNAANHLRASRSYTKKNRPLPVLSVVDEGILRGYVPFDKDWTGFSAEEYREASESVMQEKQQDTVEVMNRLDLSGYEVVRAQYFATLQNPAMTLSNGKLRFNTACLKKFEDVEYVELLLNSVDRCIAIRPCEKDNANAIRWGRLKEGRWCASTLGCRGLAKALFDMMEWEEGLKYRFRGQLVGQDDDKLMLFELDDPEMVKVEEIVLPSKEQDEEGKTVKQTIYIQYIPDEACTAFVEQVKSQSVLFGEEVNKNVAIVYSPLNGTGLKPVTRTLKEMGYTNITVVKEQEQPDGNFPTCPYPNPEIKEAMALGMEYAKKCNADLLLATDPDCDRVGIAVKNKAGEYELLTGNQTGMLLLDYICSQRVKHGKMPAAPVMVKTIVTMDMGEQIATHYGLRTINVLTGFKFIGEQIGKLEQQSKADSYVFGFEESYGYLTGSYVRDKDGVDGAYMICEMFSYYATQGISLLDKLNELYKTYGYCLNTLHSYEFDGSAGFAKMQSIMQAFRGGIKEFGGKKVVKLLDYAPGLDGLPKSDVLKFLLEDNCSIVVRPSGTEPKLKTYISVSAEDKEAAEKVEAEICKSAEGFLK